MWVVEKHEIEDICLPSSGKLQGANFLITSWMTRSPSGLER
jgi:hypothetical protein